jgi:branched-subunit amino acid transport protein
MSTAWLTIILASVGTFVLRASFLVFADRLVDVPPLGQRILRQIPPAVLAALVLPSLLRPEGTLDLWQPELLAGAVAGLVSWRTRNVGLTVVVGMTVLVALRELT